ncbi:MULTISPECIES: aldo/keto reductase [unclassified Leclercia]|uniref:Aldo/keto reductase n=1 Tax=Leclercia barmai TaxID=2785629 RepID=A0ABS7RT69_9ENTR|nr:MULTISPECIES: aldo/keto reductase [unclassified Leclercia]MBZ0057520.1 aldo/keto reductase [Leclercia sp. EMC7]MCM5695682.1 aldo/keto reductase [Leclercia sp. LTM01]MCM5700090.1 aldo/keto reductase [Leclercia sp. LTM14]
MSEKTVTFVDNRVLPAIGQGTWYMGEKASQRRQESDALRAGIERGLTLIDTAEMYAEGGAEEVVGEAIKGQRDKVFLVSKVYPWNAGGQKGIAACEASLRRLGTDRIDLYLLHWRGNYPLEETVGLMETMQQQGKIGRWGVSNLDYADMHELWQTPGGHACATNQVLYHLASRGIEYDLLPWCQQQNMPVMAYCPLAQAGRLRTGLMNHPVVNAIAREYNATAAQVLLAWVIRHRGVIAIPKASTIAHVEENAGALEISLSAEALQQLDAAFPAPQQKTPLDVV